MITGSHPPRLARWLAHATLRDERWRDVTLGDLGEEFDSRVTAGGLLRARLWYWRQVMAIATGTVGANLIFFFDLQEMDS